MTVTRYTRVRLHRVLAVLVVENTWAESLRDLTIILHRITTCCDMVDNGGDDRRMTDCLSVGSDEFLVCESIGCAGHRVRLACPSMFRGPTVSAGVWYQEMVGEGAI
jgi:hypothetical protein